MCLHDLYLSIMTDYLFKHTFARMYIADYDRIVFFKKAAGDNGVWGWLQFFTAALQTRA